MKSAEQRAIEKQIREQKQHARENARRERAKAVVDAAKHIGTFRVMNAEAETMLTAALDEIEEDYVVTVSAESFDRNITDNFALICEELQQYGAITAYLLFGDCARLTLSEAGKSYFIDKAEAVNAAHSEGELQSMRDMSIIHCSEGIWNTLSVIMVLLQERLPERFRKQRIMDSSCSMSISDLRKIILNV